ncbi:MAG: FecR domain-containing protein [Pseudomonadota bacterium]
MRIENSKNAEAKATDWLVKLHAGALDDAVKQDFANWIGKSESNKRAFLRAEKVWTIAGYADQLISTSSRLVNTSAGQPDRFNAIRENWKTALAACFALIAVAYSVMFLNKTHNELPQSEMFTTAIGETSTFTLMDNSVVTMDSNTRLALVYDKDKRKASLLKGRVKLLVTHDKQRPFELTAGNAKVLVTGTEFIVRRGDAVTNISVLSGKVNVSSHHKSTNVLAMKRLEQQEAVSINAEGAISEMPSIDLLRATSWTRGRFHYQNTKFKEVLFDINNAQNKHYVVFDSSINELIVSTDFSKEQIDAFILGFAEVHNLSLNDNLGRIIIHRQ